LILSKDDPKFKNLIDTKKLNSDSEWMKRDWNIRAKIDAFRFVCTDPDLTEEQFWQSGKNVCDIVILAKTTPIYKAIIENKKAKKMRVLDIGCGAGRTLIPMSKTFAEVTGIDVSGEMIKLAKQHTKDISNCKVLENNGVDLSLFQDDYFDFCYSIIVFQHIPSKEIIRNYIKEVARVLRKNCVFRFQLAGDIEKKPKITNTWKGVFFNSEEIHQMAKENNFEIIHESGSNSFQYWLTFRLKKRN